MNEFMQRMGMGKGVIAMLALIGMIAVSCSSETSAPDQRIEFAVELREDELEETDPPLEAPVFRWDFSAPDLVHSYSLEQEMRSKIDFGGFIDHDDESKDETKVSALMLITSKGDGTADLVLKDMKFIMATDMDEEDFHFMEQLPPIVLQGMNEDSSGSFRDASQDALLTMIFPLPPEPIKIGESVDFPAQIPFFDATGSILEATGRTRMTLTRYVMIGERVCAQFDVDTDISHLDIPEELDGEYSCSVKAQSVFYFDVANRVFVAGTIAANMQFSFDVQMPEILIPEEDFPDVQERLRMSMELDGLIRLRLIDQ